MFLRHPRWRPFPEGEVHLPVLPADGFWHAPRPGLVKVTWSPLKENGPKGCLNSIPRPSTLAKQCQAFVSSGMSAIAARRNSSHHVPREVSRSRAAWPYCLETVSVRLGPKMATAATRHARQVSLLVIKLRGLDRVLRADPCDWTGQGCSHRRNARAGLSNPGHNRCRSGESPRLSGDRPSWPSNTGRRW